MPTARLVTTAHAQTGLSQDPSLELVLKSASAEAHGPVEEEWLLQVQANKDQLLLLDFIRAYQTSFSDFKGLFYNKVQRGVRRDDLS